MRRAGHLHAVLEQRGFRRLFAVRLAGQLADGVFQASLAGDVLFNPDHQARAVDIAAGFAVLLLPYSLLGPFAGVLLDRWWRQRVLVNANLLRAAGVLAIGAEIASGMHGQPFYASALVVVSLNRFVLSALSTSLPRVVSSTELVSANAISTTTGALAATVGGALAILARLPLGSADAAYAAMAMAAAAPYLAAGLLARGFGRTELGPDDRERAGRETFRTVAGGLVAGARHVHSRKDVLYALAAIGLHRFCYGISTVCTLLLYRNYFHNDGFFRAGLAGLAQAILLVALGAGLAALLTPAATRRWGLRRWQVALFGSAAVFELALMLPYRLPLMPAAAFGLGLAAQGIEICVDTVVQQSVSDEFRGRVFSLYDTIFNVTFVGAAVFTALALPGSGHSPTSVVALALAYAVTGVAYLLASGAGGVTAPAAARRTKPATP
jgi:hypothetical protein